MKNILFILTTLVASVSFAKYAGDSRAPQALFDGSGSGANHLYIQFIPYAEDFGFGIAYEKDMGGSLGLGAAITYLPDDDTLPNIVPGLISFAGQVRLHHVVQSFDFYVAPGLNLMMMESGSEDDTALGASFAFGSLVQLGTQFAIGLELAAIQPWFNEDFYGESRGYYFNSSLTARLTF